MFGNIQKTRELCTVKKITVILALFMLFKPVLPVLEYVVFYDYIKNELCVNRDKPEMECNGKCHLAKEMANANDSESNNGNKKFFSVEVGPVFCQLLSDDFFNIITEQIYKAKIGSGEDFMAKQLYLHSIFRPPIF